MKALILAAGFGTRLLPYTKTIPKPLFTLLSQPMLEHTIQKLADLGCEQIIINTHHLHEQISSFVQQNRYQDIIKTVYEPVILDTGGAISNVRPFLEDSDFFVINSDIISNIDLKKVYKFHKKSNCLATLVLHDHDKFNKIKIDDQFYIQNFNSKADGLAFTGVHVLSPHIFSFFPNTSKSCQSYISRQSCQSDKLNQSNQSGKSSPPGKSNQPDEFGKQTKKIFSIIKVYKNICQQKKVKAFVDNNIFWSDMGTTDSYSKTSLLLLAALQFKIDQAKIKNIKVSKLAGDGSDRKWYRTSYEDKSFIISDHGICLPNKESRLQLNAFIKIGDHLSQKTLERSKLIPVPTIYNYDKLSGMVILEDLGDTHLETVIKEKNSDEFTLQIYKKVIDELINFSIKGLLDFKKEWTCQTQTYSKELILEKECKYFLEEFIQNYLNLNFSFNDLSNEFDYIAKCALKYGFTGLMHRDMQSRNIMVNSDKKSNNYYIHFIDFQGARSGPLQYDLASLLIDPYTNLNGHLRDKLLLYTIRKLKLNKKESHNFLQCYQYCCLTRNMQFLGAFSFLSMKKNKKNFEKYIPVALESIKRIITQFNMNITTPNLAKLILSISGSRAKKNYTMISVLNRD